MVVPFYSCTMDTPGALDPSFGGDPAPGLVVTDVGGLDSARAIIRQPDGKLVAAGSNGSDFVLVRYNTDGSLDSSFGDQGIVTTDINSNTNEANALIIQPDGKLVAAGYAFSGGQKFALARYNPDGTLDDSFGDEGIVVSDFGIVINALIIQPDGKLVAGGRGTGTAFGLARYLSDGTLDPDFGNQGTVITPIGIADILNALIIQPDGKLVAAGRANIAGDVNFALARYNPNGTLDDSFGNGTGIVTTDFAGTGAQDEANALIIQSDGKLVAAGRTGTAAVANFALARYLTNGDLDPSFGDGGKVTTDFNVAQDIAFALRLQPDGKLVAAGQTGIGVASNFALARYLTNGNLDSSFGGGSLGPKPGTVITDFDAGEDIARALVFQAEGTQLKLVAAGRGTIAGDANFGLAQYFLINNLSPLASAAIAKYCLN